MLTLTCFSVGIVIYEYRTSLYLQGSAKLRHTYIWPADLIFILFTLLELVLKVCGCVASIEGGRGGKEREEGRERIYS